MFTRDGEGFNFPVGVLDGEFKDMNYSDLINCGEFLSVISKLSP